MPVEPTIDERNKPEETFASRKGEVKLCPMCRNATLPPSMRLHCKWCMGSGYVAICLPCGGKGIITTLAAWDHKSSHGSTCDTCGGLKFIPSRLSEFEQWQNAHPIPVEANSEGGEKTETPPSPSPPPIIPPPPVGANSD
jgi:hypothetical protein